MSSYVKSTNFASKDSLAIGNPLKIVKGTEIDAEFNNIATAIDTKADLNSPTFIGTPVAPTAGAGTNTTQLATTAFVTDAVASGKVSPALTGVPTAPTAAVNTNTTQVATTAFVVAQIADDAPTKTGGGASGTWGINITGNAATVTSVTAAQVLGATTGAQAGDVGSYAFLSYIVNTPVAVGTLIAGSSLRYRGATSSSATAGNYFDALGSSAPAGTWRLMGYIEGYYEYYGVNGNHSSVSSLWLRIS